MKNVKGFLIRVIHSGYKTQKMSADLVATFIRHRKYTKKSVFIMPLILEKLKGHIAFGLSVHTYVRLLHFFETFEWCMLGF